MKKLNIGRVLLLVAMVLLGLYMLACDRVSSLYPYRDLFATLSILAIFNSILISVHKIRHKK